VSRSSVAGPLNDLTEQRRASALAIIGPLVAYVMGTGLRVNSILPSIIDTQAKTESSAVYATLLDEGKHLCSIRAMTRLLKRRGESRECRDQLAHILSCCLTYSLERTRRVAPARSPGRVLLSQVRFGLSPSLQPLRRRLPGVVRGLLRYCGALRLPRSVRHRRTSLDFPMRPRATASLGELEISRFPNEVPPYVPGVSGRAGLQSITSRYRCIGWVLPLLLTASASRSERLTRLNTRPARSLVNASTPPWRAALHDAGPMWVATPLSCDFFIHYASPV
jgi:hypothetical protein